MGIRLSAVDDVNTVTLPVFMINSHSPLSRKNKLFKNVVPASGLGLLEGSKLIVQYSKMNQVRECTDEVMPEWRGRVPKWNTRAAPAKNAVRKTVCDP
jgi:hypothetical protein